MKKLNVIDLDKTLIPYDSFESIVLDRIKSGKIVYLFWSILRKLRIIDRETYKQKIFLLLKNEKQIVIDRIIDLIKESLDKNVLSIISAHSSEDEENIIVSASPNIYVKKIKDFLGWESYGSDYYNGRFINLYRENKIKFILEKYPKDKYYYNFAISDSETDKHLLDLFKQQKLYKRK